MKKPVIIWVSALVLLASATLLFAQTATGSSLITQMKATVHSFNLLADLNGTVTNPSDYISSPVIGKKTGDMLTAGEWNRVLELVAQGGGGGGAGFEINDATTKTRYSIIWNGISWANNPKGMGWLGGDYTGLADCGTYFAGTLTTNCKMIETAAHDFCQIVFTGWAVGHSELNYIGGKRYRIITSGFVKFTSGTIVECYDNAGGGSTTGGGGGGTSPIICNKTFAVPAVNRTGVTFTAADCGGTLPDNTYIGVLSKYGVPGGEFHPNVINAGETTEGIAGPGFFVWSVSATAGNWYVRIVYIKTGDTGGGGGGGGGAAACTVRSFAIQCAGAAQNYSCATARQTCQAQPGYVSGVEDGQNANARIQCTVCD